MNVKSLILYVIVVLSISIFLVSCAVKKEGEAYFYPSPEEEYPEESPSPTASPTPECYTDLDCGTPTETKYCLNNSACVNITTPTCINPGTPSAYCTLVGSGDCEYCPYGCFNGACLAPPTNQTNQTGNIYATSYPTLANLYIDNVYKGRTPKTVSVNVGNHQVKFTKTDYYDYITSAYVYAGQTTYVHANLTLMPTQNQTNQTNQTCIYHYSYSCYNNDVYWYSSCGEREDKKEECGSSSCGSYGNWYCIINSTTIRARERTYYNRGCSGNSCYNNSYTDTETFDCSIYGQICSGGYCVGINATNTTGNYT